MPPTRNRPRQPNCGRICPPTIPASDPPSERDEDRQDAERHDTSEQGHAAPESVADEPPDEAANHHPEHPRGLDRHECGPSQMPLFDQSRNGGGKQLVVQPVEDDRHRRRENEELLVGAPPPFVEQRTHVEGLLHSLPNMGLRPIRRVIANLMRAFRKAAAQNRPSAGSDTDCSPDRCTR
jgi:hypothetical protein